MVIMNKDFRVFYWNNSKWLMIDYNSGPGLPTLDDFKRDYRELPWINTVLTGTPEEKMGQLFERYNDDNNPMGTKPMQNWIRDNLQPSPHTSMSVGDIIEISGELYIVKGVGWTKLPFKAPDAFLGDTNG